MSIFTNEVFDIYTSSQRTSTSDVHQSQRAPCVINPPPPPIAHSDEINPEGTPTSHHLCNIHAACARLATELRA